MKTIQTTTVFFLLGSAQAFMAPPPSFGVIPALSMSEAADAEATPAAHTPSKWTIPTIRKSIDGLTKDNFSTTLSDIEPFLLKTAGISVYKKSMKRISRQSKVLGVSMPENYAKEAKATAKRREKQDNFIKAKIEEVEAAAAEAKEAEEAAAAEAKAAEEAAAEAKAAEEAAAAEAKAAEEAAPEEPAAEAE